MNLCRNILWVSTLLAVQLADAQHHPLMQGPVRSEEFSVFDVVMIRTVLEIRSEDEPIAGLTFVHAIAPSGTSGTLHLKKLGYEVSGVTLFGEDLDFLQTDSLLSLQLPALTASRATEWVIHVSFEVTRGLVVRTSDDMLSALWSPSGAGADIWHPTPMDQLDEYHTQLRISAPESWQVMVSSAGSIEPSGALGDGFSNRPVFSGSTGFLAFNGDVFKGGRTSPAALIFDSEGVNMEEIEGVLADLESVKVFLDSGAYISYDTAFTSAFARGMRNAAVFDGFAIFPVTPTITSNPWRDRYQIIRTLMSASLRPALESVIPTDVWLSEATAAWLSIQFLIESEGEDIAGIILERLRDSYLSESRQYRRPLVWDRWEDPSDLLDEHSRGKGLWVFRMLNERVGASAMREALSRFLEIASNEVVDSETLRESLELVSGQDLGAFFDTWVYSAGHPELSVSYRYDPDSESTIVTTAQSQDGPLVPDAFEFDITYQYSSLDGTDTVHLRLDKQRVTTTISSSLPLRYVFPDAFAMVLLDFASPLSTDDIVAQLKDTFSPVPEIRSLRYLARTGPDPGTLLGLRSFLDQETDPAVLASVCELLAEMAPSSSALSLLTRYARYPDTRVQAAAIASLVRFSANQGASTLALNAANTSADTYVLSSAVSTLIHLRPSLAWSIVQSALVTPSRGDAVARRALGLIDSTMAGDRELFGTIRPFIGDEHSTPLRIAAFEAFARIDSAGVTVGRTARSWLQDNQLQLRRAAVTALSRYSDINLDQDTLLRAVSVESSRSLRIEMILLARSRFSARVDL